MKKLREVNTWMHSKLIDRRQQTPISMFIRLANEMIMTSIRDATPCPSPGFEMWKHVMGELVAFTNTLHDDKDMSADLANFVTEVLADLALRGSGGSISQEQMLIMLIRAAKWDHLFEMRIKRSGDAVVRSRPQFEVEHGFPISIRLPASSIDDLHYTI